MQNKRYKKPESSFAGGIGDGGRKLLFRGIEADDRTVVIGDDAEVTPNFTKPKIMYQQV